MIGQGRTFQTGSTSRTGAKEPAAKAPVSKQREGGLWTFLTWSFFISHIVAAQQAAAANAMAADASPVEDAARSTPQPADAPVAASIVEQGGVDHAESQQSPTQLAQALDLGAPSFAVLGGQADKQAHTESIDEASANGLPRGHTPVADLGEGSSPSDSGQLQAHELGPVLDQALDPVMDVVGGLVDNVVEPLLTPVTGLVGDVVEGLAPILDQVVSPVAGLAGSVIELVEPVLDPIIMPTAAVLEEVLQSLDPIIDPVTGIAAGATALLGDAIEPVTAQIGDAIEPLVPVVNELTAPLGDIVGPLLMPVGSVLGPVTSPLLGPIADGISLLDPLTGSAADTSHEGSADLSALLGLGAGEPILIGPVATAAGSLSLPALPIVSGIDDLFAGSSYTDYNLALQSGASVNAQAAATGVGALDTLVSGIENVALTQHDSHDSGSDAPPAGLSSILGGGLRGLEWAGL